MTEIDIYNSGEPLGLTPSQLRRLLSFRINSFARMQRAFIRIGLAPDHPVRRALNDHPLVMYENYKQFLDNKRQLLGLIRAGHGDRLDALKREQENKPIDPAKLPALRTGRYSIQGPGEIDTDELFESVRPGDVRVIPGFAYSNLEESGFEMSEEKSLGFRCHQCGELVFGFSEEADYRRTAVCRCLSVILAPPYSMEFTPLEWAILVQNFLTQSKEFQTRDK